MLNAFTDWYMDTTDSNHMRTFTTLASSQGWVSHFGSDHSKHGSVNRADRASCNFVLITLLFKTVTWSDYDVGLGQQCVKMYPTNNVLEMLTLSSSSFNARLVCSISFKCSIDCSISHTRYTNQNRHDMADNMLALTLFGKVWGDVHLMYATCSNG